MPASSILLIVVSGLLGVAALAFIFSWVLARWWCTPERRISFATPSDYNLFFEHVAFTSSGRKLSGWFIPPSSRRQPCPTVILVHGWSCNGTDMLPIASMLSETGIGVLAFDVRGHGVSGPDGRITLRKFAEDIASAVEYLQTRPDVDMNSLGVIGHSMGGSGAIVAASEDSRIRAVVTSSAFGDIGVLIRNTLARLHVPSWPFAWMLRRFLESWVGTSLEDLSPSARIGRIGVPIMLIHGDSDHIVLSSHLDVLSRNARKTRAQRLVIPGRGHWDLFDDPRYARSIIAFLRESLPTDDLTRRYAQTA